jgi:hypothetical protein
MSEMGIKNENGTRNQQKTELACHYIKAYGFQIDLAKHVRIKDLNDIIELAKKRDWKLVFNLMAENTEKALGIVGEDLLFLMEENRKKLVTYFENKGVTVVDNMYSVEDVDFIDQNWTTEHYAERGRKIIASHVADSLEKFYPGSYTPIPSYTEIDSNLIRVNTKTLIFNNIGERKQYWLQEQTLNNEMSYVGEYSSKTGKDEPYSLTFQYPIKDMPKELKHLVKINFIALLTETNPNVCLVIQTEGSEDEIYWQRILLSEQIDTTNAWEHFSFSFSIPETIKHAESLKIFVHNPTQSAVFIDNFKIQFE